ncbi:MAG: NADPH-dependent FMN reductase [uncultured bacterium]|nr:MAG: NADPH-dependent FMN reductase [uncultured bacterium]
MGKVFILGVNGSSHKEGKTANLLKDILFASEKAGGETQVLHLTDYDIKHCKGCYSVDPKSCVYPCSTKDDMQRIYPLLERADAIVLGSPVYWFNMSGMMKDFIDRMTCAEGNDFMYQGKVAALAVAKEDDGAMQALMSMASALNHMGFVLLPYTIYSPGTENGKNWVPETVGLIGKKLVEVADALKKLDWREKPFIK